MKLFDYIKGNRRGKEAHRLEKEAMGDPFLWEALEGFDAVEGNHTEAIERLRRRVTERSATRRRKRWIWMASGAAAVLLLFLTIGGRFLFRGPSEPIVPYMAERIEEKETADTSRAESPMEIAQAQEGEREEYPEIVQSPVIVQDQVSALSADIQLEEAVSMEEPTLEPVAAPEQEAEQAKKITTRSRAATDSTSQLDEVVVTGFGTERREARMDAPTASISASERLADRIAGTSTGSLPDGEPVGGMEAFRKYIEENKPELYYNSGNPVRGTIILEFRVNRNGRPAGIRVEKGLLSTANEAAKRLLEEGPDWKPANGRVQVKIEF